MSGTPTKPRPARRSAREGLRRLLVAYAPVVPFFAALLAAQPEPRLPDHVRAEHMVDPGADGGAADGGEAR